MARVGTQGPRRRRGHDVGVAARRGRRGGDAPLVGGGLVGPVDQRSELRRRGLAVAAVLRLCRGPRRRRPTGRRARPRRLPLLQRRLRRRGDPRPPGGSPDGLRGLPLRRRPRDRRRPRLGDRRRRRLLPHRPLPPPRLGRIRRRRVAPVPRHRPERRARRLQNRPPPSPLADISLCPLQLLLRPHLRRLWFLPPRHPHRLRPRHRPLRLRRRGRLPRPNGQRRSRPSRRALPLVRLRRLPRRRHRPRLQGHRHRELGTPGGRLLL
mmetsp:Transcript_2668/g.6912  ORF Transcript_2668/g.6912 Transcript_2668/m.6912 type:complete len:266 (+) Transcript_2668:270-1067(+)